MVRHVRFLILYSFSVDLNFEVILMISSSSSISFCKFSFEIKFKSYAINSYVSISYAEPNEIRKKRIKSLCEFRELPSAMFDGIDTDALRN